MKPSSTQLPYASNFPKHCTTILFCALFIMTLVAGAQEVPVPPYYEILETVSGDLTKDGIEELVVVYAVPNPVRQRCNTNSLVVYHKKGEEWSILGASSAVFETMIGCSEYPLIEFTIEIDNGELVISESNRHAFYSDRYRFNEGRFRLHKSRRTEGSPCTVREELHYDAVKNIVKLKKESENCDSDTIEVLWQQNIAVPNYNLTLENRHTRNIKIVTEEPEHTVYLSHGRVEY